MKPIALLLALASAVPAAAEPSTLRTLDGQLFHECVVVRVHPDSLSFRHANGAARVDFAQLDPDLRTRLGYDPVKAEAHRRQRAAQAAEERARRQQLDEERSEALAAAQQAEAERLRVETERARAVLAADWSRPLGPPLVAAPPPLGEAHDAGGGWSRASRFRPLLVGNYGYPGWAGGCLSSHWHSGAWGGLGWRGSGVSLHLNW